MKISVRVSIGVGLVVAVCAFVLLESSWFPRVAVVALPVLFFLGCAAGWFSHGALAVDEPDSMPPAPTEQRVVAERLLVEVEGVLQEATRRWDRDRDTIDRHDDQRGPEIP